MLRRGGAPARRGARPRGAEALSGRPAAIEDEGDPGAGAIPTGNTYDKYGSGNPVARRLMRGFLASLDELHGLVAPGSVLDVGCGEGLLTDRVAERFEQARVVGVDLDDPALRAEWALRRRPNVQYRTGHVEALPYPDGDFELVAAIEVLEHVRDPAAALAEMARVASRFVLVSVPREPLWRALNVARGAYLRDLGNTPGHVQHFSRRALERLVSEHARIEQVRAPLPWTMVLARVER